MVYELNDVSFKIGQKWLLKKITFSIKPNLFTGIIGPNGSGKSTLLRIMAGELRPSSGALHFYGISLAKKSCEDLSKERAMLSQNSLGSLPFRAYEITAMGLRNQSSSIFDDSRYIKSLPFMKMAAVDEYAGREYATLSGGESKRVDVARMLAQETNVCLLDEPTNHLDPYYQSYVLKKCKSLVSDGRTVVGVLHDLNLAIQYTDELIVLKEGEFVAQGKPQDIITKDLIKHVYHIDCELVSHPTKKICIFFN